MHPQNVRQKHAKAGRKAAIARLKIERPNMTNQDIADELFLNAKTVSKLSVEIHEEWKQRYLSDRDTHVTRQLAQLDHIKAEAWKAWGDKRFVREKVIKSKTAISTDDDNRDGYHKPGEKTKVVIIAEQQNLGIDCLKTILECLRQEAALCGLDAPRKQEISVVVEKMRDVHAAIVAKLADILTPEQFLALEQMLDAERAAMVQGLPEIVIPASPSAGLSRA